MTDHSTTEELVMDLDLNTRVRLVLPVLYDVMVCRWESSVYRYATTGTA